MYYVRLTEANNGMLRPEEISAVSPMDGITEAMRENHGTASAVSPEGRKLWRWPKKSWWEQWRWDELRAALRLCPPLPSPPLARWPLLSPTPVSGSWAACQSGWGHLPWDGCRPAEGRAFRSGSPERYFKSFWLTPWLWITVTFFGMNVYCMFVV